MRHIETLDRVESLIVSAVGVDRWEGMPGVDDLPALDRALGELDLDAHSMRQVRAARKIIDGMGGEG